MRQTFILLLALTSAIPSSANTTRKVFDAPCARLWRAMNETLREGAKYKYEVLSKDKATMTVTYNIGSAMTGVRTNSASLRPSGRGCALEVEWAFTGWSHNDAGPFIKRVAKSLESLPAGDDEDESAEDEDDRQGPNQRRPTPLDPINEGRSGVGLPPLVYAAPTDPFRFSTACRYNLSLLNKECRQGIAPSCQVGQAMQASCGGGSPQGGSGSPQGGTPQQQNCLRDCSRLHAMTIRSCMGGSHDGDCADWKISQKDEECKKSCQ